MDVQATPSPYAALDTTKPLAGNPPALGQQVPGHTGGLPAQAGLSVLANPMAEALRSKGRGEDTMLVHMTPGEVNSLQGLAMAAGGSLTINPETGLPEAGWLGKLLPTILGGIGMAFGIPPIWMGAAGAVGGTIATGDLGKGLAMGLQAYGGASLGGALGVGGKLGNVGASLGLPGAQAAGAAGAASTAGTAASSAAPLSGTEAALTNIGKEVGNLSFPSTGLGGLGGGSAMGMGMNLGAQNLAGSAINAAGKTGLAGFAQGFGDAAKMGLPGGIVGKVAPMLAAQGVMSGVSNAMTPTVKTAQEQTDNSYAGPYTAQRRTATFAPDTQSLLDSTKERRYFDIDMPEVYNTQGQIVQPGSSTAPGTPILQNVLSPDIVKPGFLGLGTKTVKNANKYTQQWVPYMGAGYAEGGEVDTKAQQAKGVERNYSFKQLGGLTPTDPVAATRPTGKMNTLMAMRDERLGSIMGLKGAAKAAKLRANQPQPSPELARAIGGGSSRLQDMRNVNTFNDGGEVKLADGAFVVDARTVSELGNGSSNAGIEMLARMGGRPVRGPGDGVSDSVPARIGRDQPARVARDEVVFDPAAVRRIGKGDEKRGADKLYAMMDKAHKARKRAGRGSDTKLRKGLA